ncbi:MAG: hypothetical protein ACJAT7_000615 [Psychromonas sp.]|jgi:hypothetical protein|uniref:multiheme c-type cytochrome n=1 Tax=Psychromonas sp. TaxID=1884585 RepID=UPI0039E68A3B
MKKLMLSLLLAMMVLSGCNTGTSTTDDSTGGVEPPVFQSGDYTLLAWNDLGMHCIDGKDYSVFSILPPYNDLKAQLILKQGIVDKHVTSGVTLTYESAPSLTGELNTSSVNKTNFWDYVKLLFGVTLDDDLGLVGNRTPSTTPAPLAYNNEHTWWEADGIPIMNYDDNGKVNYYPMVKVVAKDSQGNLLASTQVVLPVSDEMDCQQCHASNSHPDTTPKAGWENNSDLLKDFKLNILKLHDDKHDVSSYLSQLQGNGYNYTASLYETAINGTPILCAACHQSNALGTKGFSGIKSLTASLHALHANVTLPGSTLILDDSSNRDSCYACHPGATTECLRGAMGKAKNPDGSQLMQCQSCHGNMSAVGQSARNGWMEEPDCQSCHQEGLRYTEAVIDNAGTLRSAWDTTFATNDNTPVSGSNLYRFSSGHGEMQCSACHGSTHAIYPSSHAEDNLQSIVVQGHSGTVAECTACHSTTPKTSNGGPHGMHSIGQYWVNEHKDSAEKDTQVCAQCHGADYRGTFLSKTFSARSFATEWGTKQFASGHQIGCYDCHNGPKDD